MDFCFCHMNCFGGFDIILKPAREKLTLLESTICCEIIQSVLDIKISFVCDIFSRYVKTSCKFFASHFIVHICMCEICLFTNPNECRIVLSRSRQILYLYPRNTSVWKTKGMMGYVHVVSLKDFRKEWYTVKSGRIFFPLKLHYRILSRHYFKRHFNGYPVAIGLSHLPPCFFSRHNG